MTFSDFRDPGKAYRPLSFWFWNDRLDHQELIRQIAEMDEKGFGGFFMHSRPGIQTTYLSGDWMDCVKVCIEEAEKRGMEAWLYDEELWPSGGAGGLVASEDVEFRQKELLLLMSPKRHEVPESVAVFSCDMSGGMPRDLRPIKREDVPEKNKVFLYFLNRILPIGNPSRYAAFFGGFCYADVLNPDAVARFLSTSHDSYKEAVGEHFGKGVLGFFTDEPRAHATNDTTKMFVPLQRSWLYSHFGLPWTTGFPEHFEEQHGYSIVEHLPSLFFDAGDYASVRHDYWKALRDLFMRAFTRQLYSWCKSNSMKHVGHYQNEESLIGQMYCSGAMMPHYEYMHIPGVDQLTRNTEFKRIPQVKQAASIGEQLEKPRILSETYGVSGYSLSFQDQKRIADFIFVLGVNQLILHGSHYSLRGLRKRECPPPIGYQQPWWKHNRLISDYQSRLCYLLSQGRRVVDTLVLHPISGAWTCFTPVNPTQAQSMECSFAWLLRELLDIHRDYELGDDAIIENHGRIEGERFCIGASSYGNVIVPPTPSLNRKVFDLLRRFVSAGGKCAVIGAPPSMLDGRPSQDVRDFFRGVPSIEDRDAKSLSAFFSDRPADVVITGQGAKDVWYHLREIDGKGILFLANVSEEDGCSVRIKLPVGGGVHLWNPQTGNTRSVAIDSTQDGVEIPFDFVASGSALFVIDEGADITSESSVPRQSELEPAPNRIIRLQNGWTFERTAANALVLDYCQIKTGAGEFGEPLPVIKIFRSLPKFGFGTPFVLRFSFQSDLTGKDVSDCRLVVENPEKYQITVNQNAVEYNDGGYWVDRSFMTIDIREYLLSGENVIELGGCVDFDTELENLIVIGGFRVISVEEGGLRITDEMELPEGGDITRQGYPFYTHPFVLRQKFPLSRSPSRAILRLEGIEAVVVRVLVNGNLGGRLFFKPFEMDITDFVHEGMNELRLELTGTLRNLMGPHHNREGEPRSVFPLSFEFDENWTDVYQLIPYGLGAAVIELYD